MMNYMGQTMYLFTYFVEENGSTSRISERQFIHRNTVLYKIKKIEMLLDMDLSNPFTKTNLYIAF